MRWIVCILFPLVGASASFGQSVIAQPHVLRDTLTLTDTTRQRPIQVAIYRAEALHMPEAPLILFSHGWNENKPRTYLLYRWLLEPLAKDGHVVVSVQHELPTDPPLPMQGDLRTARRPSWERGADNLLHVLQAMRRSHPELAYDRLTLIGHSQGGDISMFFAAEHPELLQKVIALDNRRFPLPRTASPRVYTVRSSDQPADEGVLPTPEEQARHGITIVHPEGISHNDMGNQGTPKQQAEVLRLVRGFLAE